MSSVSCLVFGIDYYFSSDLEPFKPNNDLSSPSTPFAPPPPVATLPTPPIPPTAPPPPPPAAAPPPAVPLGVTLGRY